MANKLEFLKRGELAIISIQNPPRNTLSAEVLGEFPNIIESVKNDSSIKAVIITGKGLFSAGAEVKDIWGIVERGNVDDAIKLLSGANAVTDAIENLGKPVIAVVDGVCVGGGNELAMACSARIATEDSRFGQPEINLGIMPGMGGTQRLLLYVELEPALKLLLSGAMITAKEALEIGLVDKVVSKKDIFSEAKKFAMKVIENGVTRNIPELMNPENVRRIISGESFKTIIGSKSKDAVDSIIKAVEEGILMLLPEGLKNEQKLFAELAMKGSAKEGLAKFLKKNQPSKGARFLLPSDKLPDVFTVGDLNEDQLLIRDTVREIVTKTIATPEASARIESKDFKYTRELMKEFADVGLLGIEVPEEYGGVNLGAIVSAVAAEEISVQGSFATTLMAHTGIGTLPIVYFGTDEQKKKYLLKLVSGEWISAYSLTEESAGSDANGVRAVARLSEDGKYFILNGEKIFVTNGGFADLFIIFAKIDEKDLTAFIVERGFEGLKVGREEHKMGIQGSSTAVILLDSVKVPVENLLGERGKGFKIAVNILNLGRFKLGAACLGGGRVCLKESLEYSKQRKQFGVSISTFGAIRRKLAEIAAKNYEMEAIVYRTAGLLEEEIHGVDSGDSRAVLKAIEEYAVECSLVKVACSEALDFVVDENVQIHGGSGFCEELPPARHYRDSRINRIFEGTNEVNRLVAIGMTLKKTLTGALPLTDAVKNTVQELSGTSPAEPQDVIESLIWHLNNAKKATLLSFGMAYEKFGLGLEKHQMVLMNLADCLISVYVLESVLAALVKNKTDMNLSLTRLVFNDNFSKLGKSTRELVGMCVDGNEAKKRLSMINRLVGFSDVNVEELCNGISDNLLGA